MENEMTKNFVPQSREEAVQQLVDVALSYRRAYVRPRSIGRQVARKAIRKARKVRNAPDWTKAMLAGF